MDTFLEKLRKHLEETSVENFLKKWEETAPFDESAYKIRDFLEDKVKYSFSCGLGEECSSNNNFGSKNSSSFFIL